MGKFSVSKFFSVINLYIKIYSQIFLKILNVSYRVFKVLVETDFWKNQKLKISCQTLFKWEIKVSLKQKIKNKQQEIKEY